MLNQPCIHNFLNLFLREMKDLRSVNSFDDHSNNDLLQLRFNNSNNSNILVLWHCNCQGNVNAKKRRVSHCIVQKKWRWNLFHCCGCTKGCDVYLIAVLGQKGHWVCLTAVLWQNGHWVYLTAVLWQKGYWVYLTAVLAQRGHWVYLTVVLGQRGHWVYLTAVLWQMGHWIYLTAVLGQRGHWVYLTAVLGEKGHWVYLTAVLGQKGHWVYLTAMLGQKGHWVCVQVFKIQLKKKHESIKKWILCNIGIWYKYQKEMLS